MNLHILFNGRSFSIGASALIVCCGLSCGTIQLLSHWTNAPATIDGNLSDWAGSISTSNESDGITLGAMNDSASLCLAFSVTHSTAQQLIERGGIAMWIDPGGNGGQQFGFRAPPLLHISKKRAQELLNSPEVVTHDGNGLRYTKIENAPGVEFGWSWKDSLLCVEFKAPLHTSVEHPFAVNAIPGQTVSVHLSTVARILASAPAADRHYSHRSYTPQYQTGIIHLTRGRSGGSWGHMSSLDYWADVHLATPDTTLR